MGKAVKRITDIAVLYALYAVLSVDGGMTNIAARSLVRRGGSIWALSVSAFLAAGSTRVRRFSQPPPEYG